MRLPALFALAALAGLAACDSAKVNELTGAKPPVAATAPAACPPTTAPACPPAQPVMPPEAAKAPLPPAAAPAHHAKISRAAWTKPHAARHARRAVAHHATHLPPVTRNAYAGGYTGETAEYREHRHHERRYARPDEAPAQAYDRQERYYDRREDGYDRYTFERREEGHAPYVEERDFDRYGNEAYRYERREGGQDGYRYERHEAYSSGGGRVLPPPPRPDDCDCRPQAAGRDRQGFLTWPGKQP